MMGRCALAGIRLHVLKRQRFRHGGLLDVLFTRNLLR